jgi:endoribonuclease Dicer
MISDAQNIKDQDSHALIPIVKVMNDFYRVTDPLSRPRIFAMAIADRGFHFDSGMIKLENTLDAKVFGISAEKRAEILALPDRPNEVVVMYDVPVRATETKLFKQLHRLDPSEDIFRHHFKASRHALAEVGACASDLVWRRALKEIEATVPPWYEEDDDLQAQAGTSVSIADAKRIRDIVKNWDFTMPNLDSSSRGFNVTPKFLRLVQILKSCEPYGEGFRGIVFGVST